MTNSWQSSALKLIFAPAFSVMAIAGCSPSDGARELEIGRAALEAGDYNRAEKYLLKAESLKQPNVDAYVLLALLKSQKGGDIVEAEKWIRRAEVVSGVDVDVRMLAAQIACAKPDFAKAERLFKGIAEDEQLAKELRSQAMTGLGLVAWWNNGYDGARLWFLKALRVNNYDAAAHYHLAKLYQVSPFAYPEAALEEFEKYVHLCRGAASPRVQEVQQKIIPSIRDTIAQTAAERPGVDRRNGSACQAELSKADVAFKNSTFKIARTAYQDALTHDPLSHEAAIGLARALQRLDSSNSGQRKALEAYRTACSLKPSSLATHLEAGKLAERLGMAAQAREIYSRAIAANPLSYDALDGLIRALGKAGDRKTAQLYQQYRDFIVATRKR